MPIAGSNAVVYVQAWIEPHKLSNPCAPVWTMVSVRQWRNALALAAIAVTTQGLAIGKLIERVWTAWRQRYDMINHGRLVAQQAVAAVMGNDGWPGNAVLWASIHAPSHCGCLAMLWMPVTPAAYGSRSI